MGAMRERNMQRYDNWRKCVVQLESKGLTQREIAKRTGLGLGTVNRLKNRQNYSPRVITAEALVMCLSSLEENVPQMEHD